MVSNASSGDQSVHKRMRLPRLRPELRMKKRRDKEGVAGQFHGSHFTGFGDRRNAKSGGFKARHEGGIHVIAAKVAFFSALPAVDRMKSGSFNDLDRPGPMQCRQV